MKTIKCFILCVLFAVIPTITFAQSMSSIVDKSSNLVSYIEKEHDLEVVRIEMDILHDSKSTIRNLQTGWNYIIVAFGDERFKDIDVKVYKRLGGDWTLVKKDNDSSSVAMVDISPEYTSDYKIEIIAYSFEPGYDVGHYGLIIAHE